MKNTLRQDSPKGRIFVVIFMTCLIGLGGTVSALGAGNSAQLRQGKRAFETGDFEKAFEHYTLAEEEQPQSAQAAYHLGTILYLQGNYHEALEAFQRVTPRDREIAVLATFSQGNSLARIGELEEKTNVSEALEYYWDSIGAYRRTLSLDPGFWDAAYNIEIVKYRIRNLLEMMDMLATADTLDSPQGTPQQDSGESSDSDSEYSQESTSDQSLGEEAEARDETAQDILKEEMQRRAEQNLSEGGRSNAARDW
jgi:tetratricopeptide (TPR) repeat protein